MRVTSKDRGRRAKEGEQDKPERKADFRVLRIESWSKEKRKLD